MGFQHPKSINRSSKINIKDWDSFKKGLYNSFSVVLTSCIMAIFVQGQSELVINYYIHFVDTINNIEASTRCTHKVGRCSQSKGRCQNQRHHLCCPCLNNLLLYRLLRPHFPKSVCFLSQITLLGWDDLPILHNSYLCWRDGRPLMQRRDAQIHSKGACWQQGHQRNRNLSGVPLWCLENQAQYVLLLNNPPCISNPLQPPSTNKPSKKTTKLTAKNVECCYCLKMGH